MPTKTKPLSEEARKEIGFYLPVSPFDLLNADNSKLLGEGNPVKKIDINKIKKVKKCQLK